MNFKSITPNIGVKSVDETVKFYTEVLGFDVVTSTHDANKLIWAMIKTEGATIMFQDYKSLQDEYPELKERSLNSIFSLYIKVRNKKDLYEKIQNTNYLIKDLNTTPYGVEEFAIKDNNGFILTFSEASEPIMNYDNLFLPVDDYEKSKNFYSEKLDLKIKFEFKEQGMIAFSVGDEEPAIILKDKKKFPNSKPTIWIEVIDVKSIYNTKVSSINFLTEPFKIRTGWAVEFIDPTGNTLGFVDYKD